MSEQPRQPASPQNTKRPNRPRLRNQLLFVVGILILAGGAFYTALVVATQVDRIFFPDSEIRLNIPLPGIDSGKPSNNPSDVGSGGRINILVMGLDRRPSEGNIATRTDT